MSAPTLFADLNQVLDELTDRAQRALGGNFVGAYLVGSFAMGAGNEHSDVDFLVVTGQPVEGPAEQVLRALHRELPDRPTYWARHLEGSYAPADHLRHIQRERSTWLYVDNGSREMEYSTHCNTAIVRRTLHRHGIVLAGSPTHEVVDEVDDADLIAESRRLALEYQAWLASDSTRLDDAWRQPYIVTTYCRMLATIATGDVLSKPAALEWASTNVDPVWRPLVRQTLANHPVPSTQYGGRAPAEAIEDTRRFVEHATDRAQSDW